MQLSNARVVITSAAAGAVIGGLSPLPLYSVEYAQVMAGVVVLPDSSPMAILHGRTFSLTIDAATVLLWSGLDTDSACRIMTSVMGALAFAALSLLGLAFTRNQVVAALMPLAMFGYDIGGEAHRYPFGLPITVGDLGANGVSAAVAALSLIALRSPWGLLFLGLLPGVHITWGMAAWLIAIAGGAFDPSMRRFARRHWQWLAGGIAIVAAAWLLHQALAPAFPGGPAIDPELVRGERRYWDMHRRPIGVDPRSFIALFAGDAVFILLAIGALRSGFARRRGLVFWLIGALAIAIPALVNSLVDQVAPGAMPFEVSAFGLSRWLNLNTIALPALAVGLIWYAMTQQSRRRLAMSGIATVLGVVAVTPFVFEWVRGNYTPFVTVSPPGAREVLERARQGRGVMVAVSGLEFLQLHTRRPQLLDLALVDIVAYAPRAGAGIEAILTDVFGASLRVPSRAEDQLAGLESRWAARSTGEWRALAQRYSVTEVMVPAEWPPLNLTRVATSRMLTLYSIEPP